MICQNYKQNKAQELFRKAESITEYIYEIEKEKPNQKNTIILEDLFAQHDNILREISHLRRGIVIDVVL